MLIEQQKEEEEDVYGDLIAIKSNRNSGSRTADKSGRPLPHTPVNHQFTIPSSQYIA